MSMSDSTLDAVRGWADAQAADLAAQAASADPFASVGADIHEDMARIYEIAAHGDGTQGDRLLEISVIAQGWISD